MSNKVKFFLMGGAIFIIIALFFISLVQAKIVCDEKTKGIGGQKYWECQGGATIKEVFGTEYTQGQNATMFIQVLDNDNQAFNSSLLCQLEVWNPSKTKIFNVGMFLLNGSNNTIFYRDFNPVPNATGVYIASASCFVPTFTNSSLEYYRFQSSVFNNNISTTQGTSTQMLTIPAGDSAFVCSTLFIEQEPYSKFGYVETVNVTGFWEGKGVAGIQSDVKLRLYKYFINTDTTQLLEQQTIININLNTTRATLRFSLNPMVFLDSSNEKLATDWCVRRVAGGTISYDFFYNGNTSLTNSSIIKLTLEKNVSIGYQELKGSGEFHVNDALTVNVPILSQSQSNTILIFVFIIIIIIFVVLVWWFS